MGIQKILIAAGIVGAARFLQTPQVPGQFRHVAKAASKAFEQLGMKLVLRLRQLVVHPQALFARRHQMGLTQIRQMPRNLGLRRANDAHQLADAKLTGFEQVEDAQACPVREGPEHDVDAVNGGCNLHSLMRI